MRLKDFYLKYILENNINYILIKNFKLKYIF